MRTKQHKSWLPGGQRITHVGYCSGSKEALQHLTALFANAQIKPIIEGSSHGHDIAVLDAEFDRALELLKQDPEASRFQIILYDT